MFSQDCVFRSFDFPSVRFRGEIYPSEEALDVYFKRIKANDIGQSTADTTAAVLEAVNKRTVATVIYVTRMNTYGAL